VLGLMDPGVAAEERETHPLDDNRSYP